MKLPEEFKTKWIAALRSGEYKQGKTYLFDGYENSFCCLGVAAAVSGMPLSSLDKTYYVGKPNLINKDLGYVDAAGDFPVVLQHGYCDSDVSQTLANMNDQQGKSFLEIADYIEENL